jgi:phosphatidylglycerol:prolipoprotein diacylglycerol transferase
MFLLLYLGRKYIKKLLPGDLFFVYLIIYPIGRFLLEFIRLDPSYVGGVNANQLTMVVVGIGAILALIIRHKTNKTKKEKSL